MIGAGMENYDADLTGIWESNIAERVVSNKT